MLARGFAFSTVLALSAVGCASTRGTVVLRADPTHAQVALGRKDVAISDTVRLYRLTCSVTAQRHELCYKHTIAEGKVTELVGDDRAIVSFPEGTTFAKSYRVEKVR